MATTEQIDRVIAILMARYPYYKGTMTPEQFTNHINLYHHLLSDLDGELLEAAAIRHITTPDDASRFFPGIGELRAHAYAILTSGEPSAEEAWEIVAAEIRRAHLYKNYSFNNPRISRAVEAIGWPTLCLSEKISVERAQFMRLYESYQVRARDELMTLPEVRAVMQRLAQARDLRQLQPPEETP